MDGKMDYGPQPPMAAGGGPDAAAQFYTSKYIRSPKHSQSTLLLLRLGAWLY